MNKTLRALIVGSVAAGLFFTVACAKVPDSNSSVKEVPLPTEIDEIDSSKLVPTDANHNCRKAPSVTTAEKASEVPMVGGGVYGYYDWAPGKTNGGQIWKTRLAYSKSNLSQMRIAPTFTQIGNVGKQVKLAEKLGSEAYINGDFFHLRGTNLLFSAMVEERELVYAPPKQTEIIGVVEEPANEHTGMQGKSYIKTSNGRIATQGLNLVYLSNGSIGAYNSLKTTVGLPSVEYLVEAVDGVVTSSSAANDFKAPSDPNTTVFVGSGDAVIKLKSLKKGDRVTYVAPKNAKTTRFLRTGLQANGTVKLPDGKTVNIRAVNDKTAKVRSGAVLFTSKLYPTTSKLAATVVTDLAGVVTSIYPNGKSINVANNEQVLQVGAESADLVRGLKVGAKLSIKNSYSIKKELPLYAAFGDRENTMINGVIVADCTPGHEDIRPRTAIGWNENGDVWFVTTTMGVRNSADVFNRFRLGGSSVHQLTAWLKELGATQAIAVDGGGSTTMYVKHPADGYRRLDLPATEWVRSVPQGITMISR
jgi:hypothetical protein